MPSQDQLWRRGAFTHYLSMLALLVLLAGCTAGDLTETSEPQVVSLEEAPVSGDLPTLGKGRGRKDRNQPTAVTAVVISPGNASLQAGGTQRFAATAKLSDGSTTSARVTWTATGGTIDASGLYTNGRSGNYRVMATSVYHNLADTASVTVSTAAPATIVSIRISPASATLQTGATQRFAASGRLSDGTTTTPDVTWTVTGGSITSDGLYTAGSQAGTYRAVATHEGNLADTATVTVTAPEPEPEPPPPPPTTVAGCPGSGYRRVVNVASASALNNALSAAQPGDQIQLAAATYTGTLNIARRGTATDSITLCGPSTAVVAGAVNITDAQYWRLQGFQVRGGWIGLQVRRSSNNRISGLEISSVGYSGIKMYDGSSRNVVTGNWIHHTGLTYPQYGEGVYVGEGRTGQPTNYYIANFNLIEGNRFGPYITAEHFDLKRETQGNVVRGNTLDATGFRLIWAGGQTAALGIADGSNQRVEGNRVANLTYSDPNNWGVFRTYAGSGTVVTENVVTGPVSAQRFYDRDHASSTVVKCDNVKPSGLAWGTSCVP